MRFKPLVIAINGAPQVGKGWLANKLTQILPYHSRIMSFKDGLRIKTMDELGWTGKDYEAFKRFRFPDGLTGREHMFRVGAETRAKDINCWSRSVTDQRKFSDPNTPIIIIDDLGFKHEQDWLPDYSELVMTIVIAPHTTRTLSQYPNDTRICLPPLNGFRAQNSDEALTLFRERLAYATPYESTIVEERINWFRQLTGGFLG